MTQAFSIHVIVTNLYGNIIDTELVINSIAMHSYISEIDNDHQIHIIWELGVSSIWPCQLEEA